MTLSVIGAGFGRTGTLSMKLALEMLGMGPCHHMQEVIDDEVLRQKWLDVVHGGQPDWEDIFQGYICTVDWPSAYYWRELAAYFPDAKVLLTVRSAESWYTSFANTILQVIDKETSVTGLGPKLVGEMTFAGRPGDKAHAIDVFERNTESVISAIPDDRLLVYELGDGWEPLCSFLGKAVPDAPFPRTNTPDQFQVMLGSDAAKQ